MDIAVLINANARRGSRRAARWVSQFLPAARVVLTGSASEERDWLDKALRKAPPRLLLAGGGDGTLVGLINILRELGHGIPLLGALPLGTGNAWAYETGCRSARKALQRLGSVGAAPLPTRSFHLVEVEGRLGHFAGTGWDAEIIHDYLAHLEKGPPGSAGLGGYLWATLTRTVPRSVLSKRATIRLVNEGAQAMGVDDRGHAFLIPGGEAEAVLYEGPLSVGSVSSVRYWGFGLRAFPFAALVPGRLSVRVYGGNALRALSRAVDIWRGRTPLPQMHDFLLDAGRMEFDRPMPCQLGGDLLGTRPMLRFNLAKEQVQLVDWAALGL
jgi:diacylglycerol kinase family enzyme